MEEPVRRHRRGHLLCGRTAFGLLIFLVCAYFAYTSFTDLHNGDFYWEKGWWMTLTWAVWLVLTAGLLSEVRCWREVLLFSLVLSALIVGLIYSTWTFAQPSGVRHAREASALLWSLAALASLTTLSRPAQPQS